MRSMKGRVTAILVIWAFILNGCASWRPLSTTDLQEDRKYVRLLLADGTEVKVQNAFVKGDSLFGTTKGEDEMVWDVPASYAVVDVLEIEEKKFSAPKTLGFVGAVVGVFLAAVVTIGIVTYEPPVIDISWPNFY